MVMLMIKFGAYKAAGVVGVCSLLSRSDNKTYELWCTTCFITRDDRFGRRARKESEKSGFRTTFLSPPFFRSFFLSFFPPSPPPQEEEGSFFSVSY